MIIVGLTGGIGSGKTTVAKMFFECGVPIYIADLEAKALMTRSKIIKRKLTALFGEKAYHNNTLNKPFIAAKIFNDKHLLKQMNDIVHPKVASHFKRWLKKQNAAYIIKEAAILFENGGYKNCDLLITVIASETTRIKRVIKRDNSTKEKIKAIINNQWSDAQKVEHSDFIIENHDIMETEKKVLEIHNKIMFQIQ